MRTYLMKLWVLLWLATLLQVPAARPAAAMPAADRLPAPSHQGTGTDDTLPKAAPGPASTLDVKPILDRMSAADRVGQLFLVTFEGTDVSAESDIAGLVRDYRVGGVVLSPANANFRSVPTELTLSSPDAGPEAIELSTPEQVIRLTNGLQFQAYGTPRPITAGPAVTTTAPLTTTATVTPTATITPTAVVDSGVRIPLLIGIDWPGDDKEMFAGSGGFSPFATEMALGAAWSSDLAEKTGAAMGGELRAAGVNLLLGPTLDVLDTPRPGERGDLGVRAFGGDPFWVGKMGTAFIRGIQTGGGGFVQTAAKHFPGQGGSDRRPEDEVATIQKSVQQLRQIELAPFAAVTADGDPRAPGMTAALMTSHIRYRGFQGNIRQLTPPISLAPQLQDLMALPEFQNWRAAGGVLMSDALGVPALRRYYDPALLKFPHRQVALDAFLAGNDLLYLSRFALEDDWKAQLSAIQETILFFQEKYESDADFRARVDASAERILQLKASIYGSDWPETVLQRNPGELNDVVGKSSGVTVSVARTALTLIDPGPDELAERMSTTPIADEKILIVTDARQEAECPSCDPAPIIPATTIQEIILRLYGPAATGLVDPDDIKSITYADLDAALNSTTVRRADIESAIAEARWIIFAQLDYNPSDYPESAALRNFLAKRSDSLRDKRLVVLAFRAPYYLDTTEISKLTAYFGVYGVTQPFLEAAVRALFREFTPIGRPPVSVPGINYDLIRQLEPDPGQVISLNPIGPAEVISGSIEIGSVVELETGAIFDRNGHLVPDGTPVEFHLAYPSESLVLAPKVETTTTGKARTTVSLDRPGELWITAQAGEAKNSTRIELRVGGDAPGSIATVVPTPTPQPTPTATATLEPTPTATLTPMPSPTSLPPPPEPPPPQPRVAFPAFIFALLGAAVAGGTAFMLRQRATAGVPGSLPSANNRTLGESLTAALWAGMAAFAAYLLYALGWLPGATKLQSGGNSWAAGLIALAGGLLTLLWTVRRGGEAAEEQPGRTL